MRIEPEIDGAHIVLLGSFNPAILTPAWFAHRGLLPAGVEESAKLIVAHPDATAFDAEWLELRARQDRFLAGTTRSPHIRIRDLVLRVFGEHLEHTPIKAFGINRVVHFRLSGASARDRVGRTLAPTSVWGAWSVALEPDGERGGMTSLTMTQMNPAERPRGGRIGVTVEPSSRVGNGRDGIYVAVNDHYVVPKEDAHASARMIELLDQNFDKSLKHSESLIDHVMSLGKEGPTA